MELQLNDRNMEYISCVQRFVYRCIKMFSPFGEEKIAINFRRKQLMEVWFKKLFTDNFWWLRSISDLIHEIRSSI